MTMKLLFLRPFSNSDTRFLVNGLSEDYDVIVPDDYSEGNLLRLIENVDVCVGNNVSDTLLSNGKEVKVFQVLGAGVNHLDLDLFSRRSVKIGNSHSNAPYVAEYAISLLFALIKKIHHHDRLMRSGTWFNPTGDEADISFLSDTIYNKKLGFLGFGNIGQRIAQLLSGFNLEAVVCSKKNKLIFENKYFRERVHFSDLREVLEKADIIFITLPLTKETDNLLSTENFKHLKKSTYLINISRAQIIDKKELYENLFNKNIQGAALDVWYDDVYEINGKKYPSKEYPFHDLQNIVLSPYRAGYVKQMTPHLTGVVENLLLYAKEGELKYVVNAEKGY